MKNLIALFTVALFLVFTSCTKEEIMEVEPVSIQNSTSQASTMYLGLEPEEDLPQASVARINARTEQSDDTNFAQVTEVEVSKVSLSQGGDELLVYFESDSDFSNSTLSIIQYLDFVDSNNTDQTLHFGVNGFAYDNGILEATFAIGTNNLTGLQLKELQYIIIEDITVD